MSYSAFHLVAGINLVSLLILIAVDYSVNLACLKNISMTLMTHTLMLRVALNLFQSLAFTVLFLHYFIRVLHLLLSCSLPLSQYSLLKVFWVRVAAVIPAHLLNFNLTGPISCHLKDDLSVLGSANFDQALLAS